MVLLLAAPLAGFTVWTAQNLLQPTSQAPTPAPAAAAGPAGLGTPRLVQPAQARTLPATAVDRGEGPEQSRTLLISSNEDGSFDATLMRGAGTTLDALSTIAAARGIMGAPGQETVRDDDAVAGSAPERRGHHRGRRRAWIRGKTSSGSASASWCSGPPIPPPN